MARPVTWERETWRAWLAGGEGPEPTVQGAVPLLRAVTGASLWGEWAKPGRQINPLKALAVLRHIRAQVDAETTGWLLVARGQGLPWEGIAEALDVTAQAARQRWATLDHPDALAELGRDPHPAIRFGVASHPATAQAVLETLAADADATVRAAVAANPSASAALRAQVGLLAD